MTWSKIILVAADAAILIEPVTNTQESDTRIRDNLLSISHSYWYSSSAAGKSRLWDWQWLRNSLLCSWQSLVPAGYGNYRSDWHMVRHQLVDFTMQVWMDKAYQVALISICQCLSMVGRWCDFCFSWLPSRVGMCVVSSHLFNIITDPSRLWIGRSLKFEVWRLKFESWSAEGWIVFF